jgi:opacity protein-like surface antigen
MRSFAFWFVNRRQPLWARNAISKRVTTAMENGMERRTMWAAIGLVSALGSTSASADETGFYAGLSLGQIKQSYDTGDWFTYDPGSGNFVPSIRVDSNNKNLGGALSLGYRVSQYFAAELSFLDSGSAEHTNYYGNGTRVTNSSRISGPVLSVLPSFSFGTNFRGYLRAGVLFAHERAGYDSGAQELSQTFGDTTWLAGAGLEYSLNDHWNMNIEYLRSGGLDEPAGSNGNHLRGITLGAKYKF